MRRNTYRHWEENIGYETLRQLAAKGLCDSEIAQAMGISPSLFERWKNKYEEFGEAIKLGRSGSDYAVIKAIYKKATGYNVRVDKTYKLKHVEYDPDTGKKVREYEELTTKPEDTHIPADIRAGTFWLKNRQPESWGDKPDGINTTEETGGVIEMPEADSIGEDSDGQ